MENCLNIECIYYKDIQEYKSDINDAIIDMIEKNERLSFAAVAQKTDINPLVIRKHPELRSYMLKRILYYKEIQSINKKIDRAVKNLLKSKKNLTFMSITSKCKFSLDLVYKNQYIKAKIRSVLTENVKKIKFQQK